MEPKSSSRPNNNITWSQVQMLVGFGSILVTVVMAWANLGARIDLLAEKQQNNNDKVAELKTTVDNINDKQHLMELDVASIKQTIDDNKARGNLTLNTKPSSSTLALVPSNYSTPVSGQSATTTTPTPAPQNNYYSATFTSTNPAGNPNNGNGNTSNNGNGNNPTSTPPKPTPTPQPGVISTITGVISSLIH